MNISNRKPEAGDVYESFKGNLYLIIGRAIHTDTREEMVIYKSDGEVMFVRPLSNFIDSVQVEDKILPRFKKVWDKNQGKQEILQGKTWLAPSL
ncbi:MAG TPA: DUF1653 domain-containing protein [Bacillota bacterium]|nr:DUF1653 domain-containing protein [Bacillota bacterium]